MKKSALACAAAIGILLAGCALNPGPFPDGGTNLGYVLEQDGPGSYTVFSIANTQPGAKADISFQGKVTEGELAVRVTGPDGSTVQDIGAFPAYLSWNARIDMPAAGEYSLEVFWNGPVRADVTGGWRLSSLATLSVVEPQAMLGGGGMILVALAFIGYALWRGWSRMYLLIGMLAWLATVIVKFALAVPVNPLLLDWLQTVLPFAWSTGPFALYVGVLTGLTEVVLVWLFLRFTRFGRAGLTDALAFGVGFGAVEAFLLGVPNLLSAAVFVSMPAEMKSMPGIVPAAFQIAQLNNLSISLAPVVERLMTVSVHIVCSVWLFDSVLRRNSSGLILAFLWKSLLDAVAGYAQLWGVFSAERIWAVEGIVAAMGLLSVWLTFRLIRDFPKPPSAQPAASAVSGESSS